MLMISYASPTGHNDLPFFPLGCLQDLHGRIGHSSLDLLLKRQVTSLTCKLNEDLPKSGHRRYCTA